MAVIRNPIPVKLICGITFAPDIRPGEVIEKLESVFSPVMLQSEVFDFSAFTSYYEEEMGRSLRKTFVCFTGVYDPGVLAAAKLQTTRIESQYSDGESRRVNLDPGYVTAAKLVLATAKDFAHRIYVGEGIYGDVQFRYRQGRFEAGKWTYPDYQSEPALSFILQVRKIFMKEEKNNVRIIEL